jgi:hypothetical protein
MDDFYGNEEEDDDMFQGMSYVHSDYDPEQWNNEVRSPLELAGALVIKQPPEQWYQRGTGQEFTIEAWRSFSEYTLELMYVPDAGGTDYELVSKTRKVGNGLIHNKYNDVRDSDTNLTVRPKINICTRKGDRLFVLQLTLSSGCIIRSRPFGVKNRKAKPNTFKSDAKRILKQLEWCPSTNTCHMCNQSYEDGHTTTCDVRLLLLGSSRARY